MKLKFLIIFLFATFNSKAQYDRLYYTDIDFRETKADTLDVKLDSILLLGMGGSLERIFFNDLGNKLIKDFSSKKIFATYTFLGKTAKEAKQQYNEIDKKGFKAVLLFCPKDTSVFDTKRRTLNITIPTTNTTDFIDIYASRKRTSYEQTFDLQLLKIDKALTQIWCASVDIDCEPAKKSGSKKLGNKILARFKSNTYIK